MTLYPIIRSNTPYYSKKSSHSLKFDEYSVLFATKFQNMSYLSIYEKYCKINIGNAISDNNSPIKVRWESFLSNSPIEQKEGDISDTSSVIFNEKSDNNQFLYPIISNRNHPYGDVILLLHGLNERNWSKYYPWAVRLCELTGKQVVMFPLANHQNRGDHLWGNPRAMMPYLRTRDQQYSTNSMSSVANVALSSRLSNFPSVFLTSGIQSCHDIEKWYDMVRSGKIEGISCEASINIMAYSIGALVSEMLMVNDIQNRWRHSKWFFFCGGPSFDLMNGISKYIMDEVAANKLNEYINRFASYPFKHSDIQTYFNSTKEIENCRSLMNTQNFYYQRTSALYPFYQNIQIVALSKDHVITPKAIIQSLKKDNESKLKISVMDYPCQYSHEMPFPLFKNKASNIIEHAFEHIMQMASNWLN